MNNVKDLVHSVPKDTREVIKELSLYTGLGLITIRKYIYKPNRIMAADDAIRIRNYFRQFMSCEIDDLITLDEDNLPKRLGMHKATPEMLKKKEDLRRRTIKSSEKH